MPYKKNYPGSPVWRVDMWLTSTPFKTSTFSKVWQKTGRPWPKMGQSAIEEKVNFLHILVTAPQSSVISCKSVAKMWRKLIGCVVQDI
jgi:hypothetical protein